MNSTIIDLEKAALERLTEARIASGSIPSEIEEMLTENGVYWDSLNEEYFDIQMFQKETFERLRMEYASQNDA
tara:strand:+ start:306 stop:524 length:219 start_codon:yes stop_codon:yes gene_type:complete